MKSAPNCGSERCPALSILPTRLARFACDFVAFARTRALAAAGLAGLGGLLENVSLVLLIPILEMVLQAGRNGGRWRRAVDLVLSQMPVESGFGRLSALVALFALLLVLRAVVISARERCLSELQLGFVEKQRSDVMRQLAAARWEQIVGLRHGRVASVIGADVELIGSALYFLTRCGSALLLLVCQVMLIVFVSPVFAAIGGAMTAVALIVMSIALRRSYRLGGQITHDHLTLNNGLGQLLGGLKLAISQNLQASFVAECEATIGQLKRRQLDFVRHQANAQLIVTTFSGLLGAVAILIGLGAAHLSAPLLITLVLVLARMSAPLASIHQGLNMLAHVLPAYQEVRQLVAELVGMPGPLETAAAASDPRDAIVFRQVSFSHRRAPQGASAVSGMRELDLKLEPGELVGVSGPSGAGKSTFADLLVGLLAPQSGTITIGATPLCGAAIAGWRQHISYVAQDPFLFHDTIRRNLQWANPQSSETDLWEALELAGAVDFVSALPDGLDTVAGERGGMMSGGERQRIALARAILRKPRLLVLDEATSALDPASEHEILARISRIRPRPTIVIIAHRSQSLAVCERRLVFDHGRLVLDSSQSSFLARGVG